MRRALLLALFAAFLALTALSCGRTGASTPGLGGAKALRIAAPSQAPLDCPWPFTVRVVDGSGLDVHAAVAIHVSIAAGLLVAGGTTSSQLDVVTAPDGTWSGLVDVASVPVGVTEDSLLARFQTTTSGEAVAAVGYVADAAPAMTATITTAGVVSSRDEIVVSGSTETVTVSTGLQDDSAFDPKRIAWATDTPSMDPFAADLDGTGGGLSVSVRVPLGVHLLYARYTDCAGKSASVAFRLESGRRDRRMKPGLPDDVQTIQVDRADPDRGWIGMPANDHPMQRYTDPSLSGNPAPEMINPNKKVSRIAWNGGGDMAATFADQNGLDFYAGSGAPPTPTAVGAAPFNQPLALATMCAPGVGVVTDGASNLIAYANGQSGGPTDLGNSIDDVESIPDAGGGCRVALSANAGIQYVQIGATATIGTPSTAIATNGTAPAIAMTPSLTWFVDAGGLESLPTFDATATPTNRIAAGALTLPNGKTFDLSPGSVARMVPATTASAESVWLVSSNVNGGSTGLVRVVLVTPRDGYGAVLAPTAVAAALVDPDPGANYQTDDVSVPTDFDGTLLRPDELWIGGKTSFQHIAWR